MKRLAHSSIVFARNAEGLELPTGLENRKAKTVLLFDPGHPESVKANPLFMADSETLDWIASFFYGSEPAALNDDRALFRDLLDIAVTGPIQEATLPGIDAQAALGPEELKRLFSLRGRPEHIRFLNRFNQLSFHSQKEALDRIRRHLSFLENARIAPAFSRAELYPPILFTEPILLVIAVSHACPEADKILAFLFQWMCHQILMRPSRPDDLRLLIYLEGVVSPESHVLKALGKKRVGVFSLSNRGEAAFLNPPEGLAVNPFAILSFKKAISLPGSLLHQLFRVRKG
ncbi:MAG: hypothetical protein EPO39_16270 [Candidatus Manganitrophaceae bacterium]|nr:MAG: hypothetical protein EPO39_16270 [Candidatus Manganitrophaceae bacterium]